MKRDGKCRFQTRPPCTDWLCTALLKRGSWFDSSRGHYKLPVFSISNVVAFLVVPAAMTV